MKIVALELKSSNKKIQKSFSEDSRLRSSMLRHEFLVGKTVFNPTKLKHETRDASARNPAGRGSVSDPVDGNISEGKC